MIYREHPDVGAILHVHAWVDGVDATTVNFPCGTAELAESVAELVREAPDPAHAIIGLKNHGLTITGSDLDEIFERVEPHIQRHVRCPERPQPLARRDFRPRSRRYFTVASIASRTGRGRKPSSSIARAGVSTTSGTRPRPPRG